MNGKRFQRLKQAAEEKKKRKGKTRAEDGEEKEEVGFWVSLFARANPSVGLGA